MVWYFEEKKLPSSWSQEALFTAHHRGVNNSEKIPYTFLEKISKNPNKTQENPKKFSKNPLKSLKIPNPVRPSKELFTPRLPPSSKTKEKRKADRRQVQVQVQVHLDQQQNRQPVGL